MKTFQVCARVNTIPSQGTFSEQLGSNQVWWTDNATDPSGLGPTYDYGSPDTRHFDGLNVGFADGHVKWMKYDKVINPPSGVANANWRLWHPDAA